MGKLPIKILTVGVIALLAIWLLRPSVSSDQAVPSANESQGNSVSGSILTGAGVAQAGAAGSAPELANAASTVAASPGIEASWAEHPKILPRELDANLSTKLQQGFNQANQKLNNGEDEAAADQYQALIDEFPNFVEPYVNLASVQAKLGNLEEARQTLLKGTEANPSTKLLFDSINVLHGALAAQAYRKALETEVTSSTSAALPKVRDLATDFAQAQRLKALTQQLDQEKSKQATLSANSAAADETKRQLELATAQLASLQTEHETTVKAVQSELALEREKAKLTESKLSQLQEQADNVESDLVAKLRIELGNAQAALQRSQRKANELDATNGDLSRQLSQAKASIAAALVDQTTVASSQSTIQSTAVTPANVSPDKVPASVVSQPTVLTQTQRNAAANLVKAWAEAWSAQDVSAYIGFYQGDYSSNANLTRQQWVAQRRVRLTNKSFINVEVRDFNVSATDNGFTVTFTQHYRSNTLDDTIRKRLSFSLNDSKDWSQAKIVSESIIRR